MTTRERHVTVTVTSRVTNVTCHRTRVTPLSRVSHATTTTPHHTMSVVTSAGGCCGCLQIQLKSVKRETAIGLGS